MTGPATIPSPSSAGHLPVHGVDLYHEVYGELGASPPLLLLPGAFMAVGSMAAWVARFAVDRTVVVADIQGPAGRRTRPARCPTSSSPTTPRRCCAAWASTGRT